MTVRAKPMTDWGPRGLPLPLGVHPIGGESLMSLLQRTAEANGFWRPADIVALAGRHGRLEHLAFSLPDASVSDLAVILNVEEGEIERRRHAGSKRVGSRQVRWFGTSIDRRLLVVSSTRRVSAQGDVPHHLAKWNVAAQRYDDRSGERLQAQCQSCRQSFGWLKAFGLDRCDKCKARTEALGIYEGNPEAWLAYVTTSTLLSHLDEIRHATMALLPAPFRDWEAGEVYNAVLEMGTAWHYPGSGPASEIAADLQHGRFGFIEPDHFWRGWNALHDFDGAFTEILGRCWTATGGESASLVSLGTLGRFQRGVGEARPFVELLRERGPDCAVAAKVPIKGSSGRVTADTTQIISSRDAARELGVAADTLRRLTTSGEALLLHRAGHGGVTLYDRRRLEAALDARRKAINASALSYRLGVPAYCLPQMADDGLLQQVQDLGAVSLAGGEDLFSEESASALTLALLSNVSGRAFDGTLPIAKSMAGWFHPKQWSMVLESVLASKLPVAAARQTKSSSVVESLMVCPDKIRQTLGPSWEFDPAEHHVSSISAAALLGCTDVTVGRLLRGGQLRFVMHANKPRIPLVSVMDFYKENLFAQGIATALGAAPRTIAKILADENVYPRSVEGAKFWSREDLSQSQHWAEIASAFA